MQKKNDFLSNFTLTNGKPVQFFSLPRVAETYSINLDSFPFSVRILLESLVRENANSHPAYTEEHIKALASWTPEQTERSEFPYMPTRVLLQDFTGVPCVVDLASLRTALVDQGQEPGKIEPSIPVDLVIDHSVQLDVAGRDDALDANMKKEFQRNHERYTFLKWGQQAFQKLRVLPPGLGICHQVNMEYLATCIASSEQDDGSILAYPDTLVGTDSHTVMINSMGVLGWGVGGIEAEAAMLGQPIPILTPQVTGVRLTGKLHDQASPTDVALAVTNLLRQHGVVGQFVEYFGPGLDSLTLADRAPIANMAPEYGATMGFFPIDQATLQYMRETGRTEEHIELVKQYCIEQGLFRTPDTPDPQYNRVIELDLSQVGPSTAGPRKPHENVKTEKLGNRFQQLLASESKAGGFGITKEKQNVQVNAGEYGTLEHGSVVIASITSCTNTSNPTLLLSAGLLAKKAVEKGLKIPPHVRTSFAPGSRVATEYLRRAGLLEPLEELGFHVAAYGCATCIGNSGPLPEEIEAAIQENELVTASVLSGNRNFEGRIHPMTKANFLCSPVLVVAYALTGTININIQETELGKDTDGKPIRLADIWPTQEEVQSLIGIANDPVLYHQEYDDFEDLNPLWKDLEAPTGAAFDWDMNSTYIRNPPFFQGLSKEPTPIQPIRKAAVLGYFSDFITTDHISPAGTIPSKSPAAYYLNEHEVSPENFNSFGSRRGNHEVMMRGTFGNIRLRNKLVEREGGYTMHLPSGQEMSIYDAAMRYKDEGIALVVIAGKMYGAGSSRDWAAKGTDLLGVKAVIAESFERIHRSNLVEMGVLPLEFISGETAETLKLTGHERISITDLSDDVKPEQILTIEAIAPDGTSKQFQAKCRIDSPIEVDYYRHGGILQFVLRNIMQE